MVTVHNSIDKFSMRNKCERIMYTEMFHKLISFYYYVLRYIL